MLELSGKGNGGGGDVPIARVRGDVADGLHTVAFAQNEVATRRVDFYVEEIEVLEGDSLLYSEQGTVITC